MSSNNLSLSQLIEETPRDSNVIDIGDIDSFGLHAQEEKRAKVKRYNQDTADRKWLAIWAAASVTLWLISVVILLFCNKNKFVVFCLENKIEIMPNISDNVLITLLATTTLNVLGLTFIVLRGHFQGTESAIKTEQNSETSNS